MKHRLVWSVALALLVGAGYVHSQVPAKPQAPATPQAPVFDGNIASIVWGGRVESITGFKPDEGSMRSLISEESSWTSIPGTPGPKDVVVSFFKRESVLVGSVTIVSMPQAHGVKDFEIWTSPASAEAGWVKAAEGALPLVPDPFKHPEQTFTFTPVEARFVKVRLLRSHQPLAANQGSFGLVRIRVFEAPTPGYVPLITRHPEIAAPPFVAEGLAAASSQPPPATGCLAAPPPPLQPGTGESRKVLLLEENYLGGSGSSVPFAVEARRLPKG